MEFVNHGYFEGAGGQSDGSDFDGLEICGENWWSSKGTSLERHR